MAKKWSFCLMAAVLLALVFGGCAPKATPTPVPTSVPPTPTAIPTKVKIAFVYIGPVGDMGWTYAHDQARLALERQFGNKIETAYIESVSPGTDIERVLWDYVQKGYQVIVATADDYNPAVRKVADELLARGDKETKFFVIEGSPDSPPNVAGYFPKGIYQAMYIWGMVAGKVTRANKIGYGAAYGVPQVINHVNAFTLGALSVNPNVEVHVVWVLNWYDPVMEKEAAEALLDFGCDVLAQHQDSMAVQQAAEERGVVGIGYDSNMNTRATIGSGVFNWIKYYAPQVQSILDGKWQSKRMFWGLETGIAEVVFNSGFDLGRLKVSDPERTMAELKKMVAEETAKIASGQLEPFTGPIYDQSGKLLFSRGLVLTFEEVNNMRWLVQGVVGSVPQ